MYIGMKMDTKIKNVCENKKCMKIYMKKLCKTSKKVPRVGIELV